MREAFAGLPLTYEGLWWDADTDGRMLSCCEFPDQPTPERTADVKQAVVDALVPFAFHEKTPEGCVTFLASVGVPGATVVDGVVVMPTPGAT